MIRELKDLAAEERWDEVLALIDSAPELSESCTPYVSIISWKSHSKLGNQILAEESLDKAIELSPGKAMLHRAKGHFHKRRGNWKLALRSYERATEIREDAPSFWASLSLAQEKTGAVSAARKSLIIALSLRPTQRNWWLRLATLCRLKKRLNSAIEAYDKALELGEEERVRAMRDETERQIENGTLEASAEYYNSIYKYSQKYRSHGRESAYIPAWKHILSLLESRNISRILDLGCGPGQFAEFLAELNSDVDYIGVDFSSVAISQARRRCPQYSFYEETLPVEDYLKFGDSDALICTEVLEHIEDDRSLMKSYPRGKFLVLSVPNFDSFAHVRYFLDRNDVVGRYGQFFREYNIEMVEISEGNILWVMSGIIKT